MKRLLVLLLLLTAEMLPLVAQTGSSSSPGQVLMVQPGGTGSRQFGDMIVTYTLTKQATAVQCTLFVNSEFVGIRTLSAISPTYNFDVQIGTGKACGLLRLLLTSSNQVSTLEGSFEYTANSTTFTFKGDIVGWYIKP